MVSIGWRWFSCFPELKIGTSYQNTSCQVKAWISSRHDLTDTGNTGCSANCPRVRDNTEELVDRGNKPTDQNTRTHPLFYPFTSAGIAVIAVAVFLLLQIMRYTRFCCYALISISSFISF